MTFRVHPDGSIEVDSPEEAIRLSRALATPAEAVEAAPEVAEAQPEQPLDPSGTSLWIPPSGTWYFHCLCGLSTKNAGISHAIEGAECSRCHVRAERPKPDPCHFCKKSMRGMSSRWLDDGHEAHVNCRDVPDALVVRFGHIGEERHVTGTDCCIEDKCAVCEKRRHRGVSLPLVGFSLCEGCDIDRWKDAVLPTPDSDAEPGTPEWFAAFRMKHGRDPMATDMSAAARPRQPCPFVGTAEPAQTSGVFTGGQPTGRGIMGMGGRQ